MKQSEFEINSSTQKYAVVGHLIGHTASPSIFNSAFRELRINAIYLALDVHPAKLKEAFRGFETLGFKGLNITTPYKKKIIPFLNKLDKNSKKIGAVNTILFESENSIGYNTDTIGFIAPIKKIGIEIKKIKTVILGLGGAALACINALNEEGCQKITVLNRSKRKMPELREMVRNKEDLEIKELNYSNLAASLISTNLLVNATPVGMSPQIDESIVPKKLLRDDMVVYDLVYRPVKSKLITDADKVGATTIPGYHMLLEQASKAFEIWTRNKAPKKVMLKALKKNLGVI